ncbi:transcriptional regulator [Geobacter sp. SVR]|uniref:transcriptional regulator n=1 Tax=Geobacter sp. SVR TaxID=2495594 RepID=UPI001563A73C|nr:transcriptional regulator [Geobacter sp. SVR]BCS55345.1 transcriptional regulator [Geobacter sp. SVR]
MRHKPRQATVPRPAPETARQAVAGLLRGPPLSVREISIKAHLSEKEVYDHLEHIRRSLQAEGCLLEVTPAECRNCGFVFAKRERLSPPGKCPLCRHEAILEPLFSVRRRRDHSKGDE